MPFNSLITMSPVEQGLMALLAIFVALTGRVHWALAIHLSISLWTRVFFVGPLPNIYATLLMLFAAVAIDLHRTRRVPSLPKEYRGIVIWMALWWVWMLLLIYFYQPSVSRNLLRQLLFYIMIPLALIPQFSWSLARLRGFAVVYILTSLFAGWKALSMIEVDLAYLLVDPTLSNTPIVRLGLVNYHWFGYMFALSLLFTVGLFMQTRHLGGLALLGANAVVCVYFLLMSGSRQSLNGAMFASAALVLWVMLSGKTQRGRVLFLAASVVAVGLWIYNTAPQLIVREGEAPGEIFNVFDDRSSLWLLGWQFFLTSPVWGTGFDFAIYSHNLFVSTLADQGLIGMGFLLGLLVFIGWQARGAVRGVGSVEIATWRMTLLAIVLFTIVHGMASGNVLSVWYLYWAAALLWVLRGMVAPEIEAAEAARPTVIWGSLGRRRPLVRQRVYARGD